MPNLPLLLPVLVLGALIGAVASRLIGRWLRCPPWVAVLLVMAFAVVAAVTLTPQQLETTGAMSWPFTWLTAWFSDRVLNVLLFVPLGVAVALIGRRALRTTAIIAALLLPWVVEGVQHLLGALTRDSQWQDVVDNSLGVVIGLALGYALRRRVLREEADEPR